MPTGYTADISKGISFEKFVLQCARAMGALIMMRDDPSDTPIPDTFEPSDYHVKELEKAEQKYSFLLHLDKEQIKEYSESSYAEQMESWRKREDEKIELANKYREMLAKVVEWQPPTKDHEGFKDFMVKQIRESIDWDCKPYEAPEKLSPDEWYSKQLKDIDWSIEYHTKEGKEEVRRSKDRSEWVQQLKASLNSEQEVA